MCSLKGCGYNNPSPSLLRLPGAWVASLLQKASQGRKTGKDPSASVVPLVRKVHWPVWKAALPWIWCWCGLFTPVWLTGRKLGQSWSTALNPPAPGAVPAVPGAHPCWQWGLHTSPETTPQPQKRVPCGTGRKLRPGTWNFSPTQPAIAAGSMPCISRTVLQGEFQQHCSVGTSTGN